MRLLLGGLRMDLVMKGCFDYFVLGDFGAKILEISNIL